MKRFSPVLERILAISTLCIAFILMASVFRPRDTRAHDDERATSRDRAHSTDPHEGLQSLGELRGSRYLVRIYSGRTSPLYSIYDHEGNELAVLLTAERAAALFPDLDLSDFHAGSDEKEYLMLVEPDERR